MSYYFTSESVSEGHPDKVADAISDAILDSFMQHKDPTLRCACETLVTTNKVIVAGEYKGFIDSLDVEYLIYLYCQQIEKLSLSSKLDWHNQDIEQLIKSTFKTQLEEITPNRTIPKSQETLILNKLNKKVQEIAHKEEINSTLFFSKKAQKDFLRQALQNGIEPACNQITSWRADLIKEEILQILK